MSGMSRSTLYLGLEIQQNTIILDPKTDVIRKENLHNILLASAGKGMSFQNKTLMVKEKTNCSSFTRGFGQL